MSLDELIFQPLRRIELIDPCDRRGRNPGIVGRSLQAGGMVLHFDQSALVCTSPQRFSRCQQGTAIGLSEHGALESLGYRLTVLDTEEAESLFLSCLYRRTIRPKAWFEPAGGEGHGEHAALLLSMALQQGSGVWALRLRLLCGWLRLSYRPDLDGFIEFAPEAAAIALKPAASSPCEPATPP